MYRSKEDETLRLIRKIMQKQKWQFKIFQSAYFKRKISLQPHLELEIISLKTILKVWSIIATMEIYDVKRQKQWWNVITALSW